MWTAETIVAELVRQTVAGEAVWEIQRWNGQFTVGRVTLNGFRFAVYQDTQRVFVSQGVESVGLGRSPELIRTLRERFPPNAGEEFLTRVLQGLTGGSRRAGEG